MWPIEVQAVVSCGASSVLWRGLLFDILADAIGADEEQAVGERVVHALVVFVDFFADMVDGLPGFEADGDEEIPAGDADGEFASEEFLHFFVEDAA